mgnify:CR=1 FL=1
MSETPAPAATPAAQAPAKTVAATPAPEPVRESAPPTPAVQPIALTLALPKSTYAIGEQFRFTISADRDCHFLVYTISANDKVEVHDPVVEPAFMGASILRAGETRQIPVPGAPGVARIDPPAGAYEIGAVCGRDSLDRIGLSGAKLKEPATRGKRGFTFTLEKATEAIKRDEISRTAISYTVTP